MPAPHAAAPADITGEGPPPPPTLDEAVGPDGQVLPHAAEALQLVRDAGPAEAARLVQRTVDDAGVAFGSVDGDGRFLVDPVPRVIGGAEWQRLEAGLVQRVRALDRFVADVYGERQIVAAGVVPADVIETSALHEPSLTALRPPGGTWIGIAGLDVVRGADGVLRVLEDNLRTPSGMAYAVAARQAVLEALGDPDHPPVPLDGLPAMLRDTIRHAAPERARADGEPTAVLLTDGPANSAHFEHRWIAEQVGIPLVTPGELSLRGGRLLLHRRGEHHEHAVDVVLRRTDEDRVETPIGRLLMPAVRTGALGLVNTMGTGVADDKRAHAYVEDMVRFYLGEEPLLPSVPTYDLARPDVLDAVDDRLHELVIKPRAGHGGVGVVIGPLEDAAVVQAAVAAVRARPADFIAQEVVQLSSHPTVIGGDLQPRHVDLRPFVMQAGERTHVLPGGLTRVAFGEDALVVNSSRSGGAKDTWVLP